jgi:hypothetical protein
MKFLRGALMTVMLLGCDDDNGGPVQPEVQDPGGPVQSRSEESGGPLAAIDDIRPTRGFFVSGFPSGATVAIRRTFTEIQKFSSLPPGKYIANASAVLASNDAELRFVDCIFTINRAIRGELARGMVGGTGRDNFVSLPLTIGFEINMTSNLGVACRSDVSGVVFSQGSPITAIRLDRLTVQQ